MTILETVLKSRENHYFHFLEVETPYEIENAIESIWAEFKDTHTSEDLKEFFNSMQITYYEVDENGEQIKNEINENEVYNFNINEFIDNNIH